MVKIYRRDEFSNRSLGNWKNEMDKLNANFSFDWKVFRIRKEFPDQESFKRKFLNRENSQVQVLANYPDATVSCAWIFLLTAKWTGDKMCAVIKIYITMMGRISTQGIQGYFYFISKILRWGLFANLVVSHLMTFRLFFSCHTEHPLII